MATCDPQTLLNDGSCFLCLSEKELNTVTAQLLCDIASGGAPCFCENLEGADSPLNVITPDFVGQVYVQAGGIVWQAGSTDSSSWTVICEPIPESGNGLVWGPDADTLDQFIYEDDAILGAAATQFTFPGLVTVVADFSIQIDALETVSAPLLESVGGDVSVVDNANLTTLQMGSIETIGSSLDFSTCPSLVDLDFSALTSIGATLNANNVGVESLYMPLLATVGAIRTDQNPSLTNIDFTSLVTNSSDWTGDSCPLLVSILVPNLVVTDGTAIQINNCALNATTVALLLRRCVVSAVTTCLIDLSGGTNAGLASLSAQGQADYAALVLAGNTVTLNP